MEQDLEEEKNKAIIKDLEDKVENYEAVLKKKDFVIQDLKIIAKEHEAALEKKDFVIHSMEGNLAEVQAENDSLKNELLKNQKNLSRKRRTLKQVSRLRSRKIQICKNH
jgi:hypothetical protein